MKPAYYLKRLFALPAVEFKLLAKGYVYCLILLPVVFFLPLKYYINYLKIKNVAGCTEEEKRYTIRLVRKTMRRINRFSPVRFTCLIKSAAFKLLLNEFGIENSLTLGINISEERVMKAHAWVKLTGQVVFLKKEIFEEVYFIK